MKYKIGKALGAMQNLTGIWKSKDISTSIKIQLYESLILSILMHGFETKTLGKEDENRLLVFEMTCLGKILGVSRLDKIRNTTIKKSTDLKDDIIGRIAQKRLRYYGHIMRMKTEIMPYIALNGMVKGVRQRGRPVKRWLDGIRNDVNKLNLTITEASRKPNPESLGKKLCREWHHSTWLEQTQKSK